MKLINQNDGKPPKQVPLAIPEGELYDLREQIGANPLIWTDRMLTALKTGVKVNKWFSLKDKFYRMSTLQAAWKQVRSKGGCAGVDKVNIKQYGNQLEQRLSSLQSKLQKGTYRAQAVKRVWIPKPGSDKKRPLGIPAVEDRIVQTALLMTIGPIFEIEFSPNSYGFRPQRGCHDALAAVDEELNNAKEWIVDADLQGYFDTIDHEILMNRIRDKIADGYILDMLEMYLEQDIFEPLQDHNPGNKGTPQGAVISPLLANLFLDELDHRFDGTGVRLIRYADDLVLICENKEQAQWALEQTRMWCETQKLILHPEKTKLVNIREGFEFLGYRFVKHKEADPHRRYVRKKSLKKLRESLRVRTKRTNGRCLAAIIKEINPTLKGWFNYFRFCHRSDMVRVDGWVRMRLRSILRKRMRKQGRGGRLDHQRWPNKYFADAGLFSLENALQSGA